MPRFGDYHIAQMTEFRYRIDSGLKGSRSLWDAGQKMADLLFDEFRESIVLARVFGTVAFGKLPEKEKHFVSQLATSRGCATELNDDTVVICLLGTRGKQANWNDRGRSRGHLAIPLLSTSFIKTIPMVAWLMGDVGTGVEWVDKQRTRTHVRSMGQMARLVHVEEAATDMTTDGYKVIPAQDFVAAHGVQTVLGFGGSYLNRAFVCIVLFTNERFSAEAAEKLMPLVNAFKTATMDLVMGG